MKETMLKLDSLQKSERGNLKWIAPIMTGIYCSVITAMPALANSQTIIQGINKGTEQVWRILIAIVAPIGAVALALQVIKIIWGGARAAEEAKSAAIKIIVAIAVVAGCNNKDTAWTYTLGNRSRYPVVSIMRAKSVAHADIDNARLANAVGIRIDVLDAIDDFQF